MELLKISDRLRSAAGLVYKGARVADIGTDHGYLPIYLVQNGISECVYACDVRKKPLERAQAHISSYGLDDNITIRLADGLCGIQKDDVDTVTICGMGGKLMKDIIEACILSVASTSMTIPMHVDNNCTMLDVLQTNTMPTIAATIPSARSNWNAS